MTKCEHIYTYVGSIICPKCDNHTHEPDWKETARLHKKHVIENPDFQYQWWSI